MAKFFRESIFGLTCFYSSVSFGMTVGMSYADPVIENGIYKQQLTISSIKDVGPEYDNPQGSCMRNSCYAGIAITDWIGTTIPYDGGTRVLVGPLKFEGVTGEPTIGQILRQLDARHFPLSGVASQNMSNWYGPYCIAIIAQNSNANNVAAYALDSSLMSCSDGSGGGILPPPPNPEISCTTEQMIELNHGVLNSKDVNGNLASEYINIKCSGKTSVRLTFTPGTVNLHSGKGLTSHLYVQGSPGSTDVIVENNANVTVSSKLQLVDDTGIGGEFTGSSILNMMIL